MVKCERCGYEGTKKEVKRSPKYFSDFKDKLICINCYKELREQSKTQKNISDSENNSKQDDDIERCSYCGSFIRKDVDVCPYCNYHFDKNKVFKREKPVRLKAKKEHTREDIDSSFPKTRDQVKKSLPKVYRYLPMATGVIFIAICLVFAGQAGVFTTIFEDSNNSLIHGSWELLDMQGSADDNFEQFWTFFENNTLKIETEFKDESDEKPDSIYYLEWEFTDDLLRVYRDYSNHDLVTTFNVVPKYSYKYVKDGTGLVLTFTYLNFDLDMKFKKVNNGLFN